MDSILTCAKRYWQIPFIDKARKNRKVQEKSKYYTANISTIQ